MERTRVATGPDGAIVEGTAPEEVIDAATDSAGTKPMAEPVALAVCCSRFSMERTRFATGTAAAVVEGIAPLKSEPEEVAAAEYSLAKHLFSCQQVRLAPKEASCLLNQSQRPLLPLVRTAMDQSLRVSPVHR